MKKPKGWKLGTLYILGDTIPYDHPATKIVGKMSRWKIDYAPIYETGRQRLL